MSVYIKLECFIGDCVTADAHVSANPWISYFTSTENRHALPLFTSLLNSVCAYDPVGYGVPYNHLMFADSREPSVEVALQVLCTTLDNEPGAGGSSSIPAAVDGTVGGTAMEASGDAATEVCNSSTGLGMGWVNVFVSKTVYLWLAAELSCHQRITS